MNPLSHAYVNAALIKRHKIKCDEDLVLVGGVLPDLALLQIMTWKQAHEDSLGFIAYLADKDPEYLSLGFGFLLHSESPRGLDFYTHSPGGFIDRMEMPVFNVVQKYKPKMFGSKLSLFIHSLTEFTADTMVPKECASRLNKAFERVDPARVAFHLSNYFKCDGKRVLRILKFFKGFDFNKLTNPKDVAATWRTFQLYQAFGKSSWIAKYTSLAQSLTFFKKGPLIKMIKDTQEVIREPLERHLEESMQGISESLIKPFPNPLSPRPLANS